jgi:polysaccharide export outer membrane protein
MDPEVNKLFNPSSGSESSSSAATTQFGSPVGQYLYGYRVLADSTVLLPVLGKVKLVGLDLEKAREVIVLRAKEYLKEPNVQVKFLNFKVNLSGEINGQGLIYNYEERLNIYDAISMGGGITEYADLRNVTIQRFDGNRVFTHKLDLTDYSAFSSDVYYLQPNDIVYIPPNKLKMRGVNTGNYSIFLGTISFLMVLITYLN